MRIRNKKFKKIKNLKKIRNLSKVFTDFPSRWNVIVLEFNKRDYIMKY